MSELGFGQWWRVVAGAFVVGGGLAGAWFGFMRPATAEPPPARPEARLRAEAPTPPPFKVPADANVIPVSGTLPIPPVASVPGPVVPVPPPAPLAAPPQITLPLPASDPVTPGPRTFELPHTSGGMSPPSIPPLPPGELPIVLPESRPVGADLPSLDTPPMTPPAPPPEFTTPAPPATLPVVATGTAFPPVPAFEPVKPLAEVKPSAEPMAPVLPTNPVVPELPALKPLPTEVPAAPTAPPVPPLPTVNPSAPAVPPLLPEKAAPPLVPPLPDFTPASPPVKVAEPLPVVPMKPDSGLPSSSGGITVKPENNGGTLPIMPPMASPPTLPTVPTAGKPGDPPAKVVDRPKPTETEYPGADKFPFSVPTTPTTPLTATPGDHIMTLNQTVATAILGGALLAPISPAVAAPPLQSIVPIVPMTPVGADDKDKIDPAQLNKQLESTNKKLDDIQKQLQDLSDLLNGKKASDGTVVYGSGMMAQVRELKDSVAKIAEELNKMKASKSQTVLSPETSTRPGAIVEPRYGKAVVRIVNEYPIQISIVVNGTSYPVAPSKVRDVEVDSGEFSYQLLQSGAAPTKSIIKDKETVTLRIK